MNLKVRIHDREYEIAQGATFSEEYNETLDSGAIRIPHVIGQIDNLRPYDDVYIYDNKYNFDEHIAEWRQGGECSDSPFYRHLLVNQYTEEVVNLDKGIFSYSIELFSETKGLEMVQVPNCSVTQPLNIKKKTDIYTYLCRFVDLYSPKYKTVDRSSTINKKKWTYAKKYSVSPELKEIFGGVYSQDFTLSNPTLKDVLSTLMITKDMIPYVKDNVIYAKAISERTGTYNIEEQKKEGKINLVVGQMSSADYCDGVRRQYSDALSQDGICHYVEHLGFRNKDNSLMTIGNMQLETTHKIYKIKKLHMCYYKKIEIIDDSDTKYGWFLCKQDITPLVKLDSEWNLLSQDWRGLSTEPTNIYDLSQYKLSTVSYSIGGNIISGWGTKYNEYKENSISAFEITKTYIENILKKVDKFSPFGIYSQGELEKYYKNNNSIPDDKVISLVPQPLTSINSLVEFDNVFLPDTMSNDDTSSYPAFKLKTLFFEIEYSGFYDGALIHSRDKGNDNLFQNDNQSSSLTLLEKDGFSQKEKLNRFANKTYTMKGRLDGSNYGVDKLLKLGQTGVISENDDDVIIYRREYSIYDNYILVSYAGIQDYVLKNFYTSVYAKYRTNQLMSYGESTNRAETQKVMLLLSKNKKFKDEDTFLTINNDKHEDVTNSKLFSAFVPNSINQSIDSATILLTDIINEDGSITERVPYKVDQQTFTSGNSLCFNIAMTDNASGGNYITKWISDYVVLVGRPSEDADYYVGTTQQWHAIVDDKETGEIKELGFSISHVEENLPLISSEESIVNNVYNISASLPKETSSELSTVVNEIKIRQYPIYKDNKDKIDMTFQIEPISCSTRDIVFGDWFMRLSDLVSYNKYEESTIVSNNGKLLEGVIDINLTSPYTTANDGVLISVSVDDSFFSSFIENQRYFRPATEISFPAKVIAQGTELEAGFRFVVNGVFWTKDSNGNNIITLIGNGGTWRTRKENYYDGHKISMLNFIWDSENDQYRTVIPVPVADYGTTFNFVSSSISNTITFNSYWERSNEIKTNMFVEYNTSEPIDKTFVYKTLPYDVDDGIFKDDNQNYYSVSKCFKLFGEGNDSYIRVYVPSKNVTSVRYWYFDFDAAYSKDYTDSNYVYQETPQKSSYKFVFGVNVNDENEIKQELDSGKYYVDIYITKTTHRDPRVFDSLGRQVGVVHNCLDSEGNYEPPEYQQYDEFKGFSFGHSLTLRIEEALSGTVDGNGLYYPGEIANITATPANDSISFYRWKNQDGTIFSKNNNESFPMKDTELTLTAQFGKEYVIWKGSDNYKTFTTTNNPIEIYTFDDEQINGDILEITSGEDFVDVKWDGLLLYRNLKLKLDPITNNSYETAVDLFSGTVWNAELRVWFDNETKTIRCQGYRGDENNPKTLTIRVPELKVALVYKPRYSKLVLDFSDEHIESITITTISAGEQTISRDNANIVNGKYVYKDENYPALATIYATSSVGYTTEYNSENPWLKLLGTNLEGDTFAPTATELKLETPVLVSSTFEKRSYTDEQYRYEWDAIVKIKNTNNVTVSPNVDWAVSSGGNTFVPTSLDIAAGEEATFVCNTDMTSAKLTISFSADGYNDSSELVVECGQSGGQE